MNIQTWIYSTICLLLSFQSFAQWRPTPPSSVLLHDLRKIQNLSSALYVAAHPDDENTRLIAWLANAELAETAYLSLTRGDGGQNLIGRELREGLGVIRTQELLAARRIDGGKQFFSRANDFGFSKHPDETYTFWDRDSILSDMVWVIRKWQPDVIITRFDPNSAGRTHGHHTASAQLAVEAFSLAADPKAFPEQLRQGVSTWQTKRIFFNTSWWFYGSQAAFDAADKSDMVELDAGTYLPSLGQSIGEIAALSRSQHASQGFGSSASRGEQPEYLKLLAGEMPSPKNELFANINQSWSRIPGGKAIEDALAKAESRFNPSEPQAILPDLLEAHRLIKALPASRYRDSKLPALEQLIADCMGLYVEASSQDSVARPGQKLQVNYEVIARLPAPSLEFKGFTSASHQLDTSSLMQANKGLSGKTQITLDAGRDANPYWLREKGTEGMYSAPGYDLRGQGENPPAANLRFHFEIQGQSFSLEAPVLYKHTWPDRGEEYRPLLTLPALSVAFVQPVYIWASAEAKTVQIKVDLLTQDSLSSSVKLVLPKGWKASPGTHNLELHPGNRSATLSFEVMPPASAEKSKLSAEVSLLKPKPGLPGKFSRSVNLLRYGHIPVQAMIQPAEVEVARLDLKRQGKRIGYVMGAGDEVPEALRAIGYQVEMLDEQAIAQGQLKDLDAIVLGVRAFNTQEWLKARHSQLLDYVQKGGNLIVQYNTDRGLDMDKLAPYPLELSRDRVTVEGAEVRFVNPQAAVLNAPNRLGKADFDGWVQERGLYFPNKWDDAFQPILGMSDPGEKESLGSLLVAPYGEGHYIYTGLSFFRQLPAGVPGAYRLFVNLLEQ